MIATRFARPTLIASFLVGLAAWPVAEGPPQISPEALFKDLRWRNLGPANMAGRISDIEAVEEVCDSLQPCVREVPGHFGA